VISSFVRERLRYTFGFLGLTVAFASPLSGQVARRFESGVVVSGAWLQANALPLDREAPHSAAIDASYRWNRWSIEAGFLRIARDLTTIQGGSAAFGKGIVCETPRRGDAGKIFRRTFAEMFNAIETTKSHDRAGSDYALISLTHYWDWTGFPVVALPSGVGRRSGLPVGVSLIGAPGADWDLLAAAGRFELVSIVIEARPWLICRCTATGSMPLSARWLPNVWRRS